MRNYAEICRKFDSFKEDNLEIRISISPFEPGLDNETRRCLNEVMNKKARTNGPIVIVTDENTASKLREAGFEVMPTMKPRSYWVR